MEGEKNEQLNGEEEQQMEGGEDEVLDDDYLLQLHQYLNEMKKQRNRLNKMLIYWMVD